MQLTKWVHEPAWISKVNELTLVSQWIDLGPRSLRFNIIFFSLETTRPIEAKFYVEPPLDWGTKACSNGPGHMTKMAAMPIYDKNFKNLLRWNRKADGLKFGMQHQVPEYYQVWSIYAPGLTLTYFMARSNLVPYAFVWEKLKQWIFQKLL